jgi:Uma2 family endonuclease
MYQPIEPRSPLETMPTMYDLPSELVGESGLPDEFHCIQADLLSETCQPVDYLPEQILLASDLNLYYDPRHTNWYKRPDWYMVLGVPRANQQQELRLSYLIWQEGVTPFLVVELLSPGTEDDDLGKRLREINQPPTKWEVYERILRVPYYVVYDRYENNLRAFEISANVYKPIPLVGQRFWIPSLGLGLGLWRGIYQGAEGLWLRWYDQSGWAPTLVEKAEAESRRADVESQRAEFERKKAAFEYERAEFERERAEFERQKAEAERHRASKLSEYLISQGIDPDKLPI